MKIWLNHILACPDDKSFPLKLWIYEWSSSKEQMKQLLIAYKSKTLVNFKHEKDPLKLQVLDPIIFESTSKSKSSGNIDALIKKAQEENKRITSNIDFGNIISIFFDGDVLNFKDYNVVKPCELKEYIEYYLGVLKEFSDIHDDSECSESADLLKLVKTTVSENLNIFSKKIKENPFQYQLDISLTDLEKLQKEESAISASMVDYLQPVLQDLLLLNWYLFLLEINEGILRCPKCSRIFPILKTIPRLMPKKMKKTELDEKFEEKWKAKIAKSVK